MPLPKPCEAQVIKQLEAARLPPDMALRWQITLNPGAEISRTLELHFDLKTQHPDRPGEISTLFRVRHVTFEQIEQASDWRYFLKIQIEVCATELLQEGFTAWFSCAPIALLRAV
jgi:hypothetical protein